MPQPFGKAAHRLGVRVIEAGGGLELDDIDAEVLPPAAPAIRVVTAHSFEDVYRTDYARMVRVAHMLTESNEAAEDIVQDAFVRLYPRFGSIDDPAGYLYRSVVNGCWSRRRHRRVVERFRHLTAGTDVAPLRDRRDVERTQEIAVPAPCGHRPAVLRGPSSGRDR
jgi:hypothetical protein